MWRRSVVQLRSPVPPSRLQRRIVYARIRARCYKRRAWPEVGFVTLVSAGQALLGRMCATRLPDAVA